MKNRTYKHRNRAIKQRGPDHWECRIIPGKGQPQAPSFVTPTKDGAFNWLRGGVAENISPGHPGCNSRRRLGPGGKLIKQPSK